MEVQGYIEVNNYFMEQYFETIMMINFYIISSFP